MTINFGIDLGTTNSAIAKFEKGQVTVFRNPAGQKQTLPSVVAFRKGRFLVGEKAREYLLKAPEDVAGSFKRKMGTTETYSLGEKTYSPTELSAFVLKELKNFIHTGENPEATIITIPASFDTIQSNATKEAGYGAGFQEVILLQEPIAASLTYANMGGQEKDFEEGKWLVYDLGGGTFDVALIQIEDGEMKVLDHEGDNFLGGNDFDKAIVEELVIPYLQSQGNFKDLFREMRKASGKYNQLYHSLLLKAEQAKIELSASEVAEIEFNTIDDEGEEVEGFMSITREQFESLVEEAFAGTLEMIGAILDRNRLHPTDLKFVLMVGGSTYIPYFRKELNRRLGIEVNTNVDPTTAVAIGAAYYAGTRSLRKKTEENQEQSQTENSFEIKLAYQKATKEQKEYLAARIKGETNDHYYRITRMDGGYDSGLKELSAKISEILPLIPDTFNQFDLKILDSFQNVLATESIGITQGQYSVVGQPLPHDICLEIDDVENNTTVLEVLFEKNSVLPLKRTIVKQITKTIAKDSSDQLVINIVEGVGTTLPAANQPIGFITISGKDLNRDLARGSDIEITLEMSESRDLSINTYVMMSDQEFQDAFNPSARRVNVRRLADELMGLAEKIRTEINEAETQDNYETAQQLVDFEFEILELADKTRKLTEEDSTDEKFQFEDKKRKLAQKVDELTRDKFIIRIKNEYFEAKRDMEYVLENYEPGEDDSLAYQNLIDQEKSVLATNSSLKIQEFIDQVRRLNFKIRWRSSQYIKDFFSSLVYGRFGSFTNQLRANELISQGMEAMNSGNDEQLRVIINQLVELLPPSRRGSVNFGGTGIG